MYKITPVDQHHEQGDERFQLELEDGSRKEFQIWDYEFLYHYPHLYYHLIVELLDCQVYGAIAKQLIHYLPSDQPLRVLDIACGSGLMGQQLKQNPQINLQYLCGIEVSPNAIKALQRDTAQIYQNCYLLPRDDLAPIRTQQINCITICGAANHLTLEDYQNYLALMDGPGWICFNLVTDVQHQGRKNILEWMDQHYHGISQQLFKHRKLISGEYIMHELFLYQQLDK